MGFFSKLKESWLKVFSSSLKKVVLVVFLISVGILIIFALWFSKEKPPPVSPRIKRALKNPKTAPYFSDLVPKGTALTDKPKGIPSAPKFKVKTYEVARSLPIVPSDLNLYVFKTNFSKEEVRNLASKLLGENLEEKKESESQIVFSNGAGFLAFDLKTGSFSFQAFVPRSIFSFDNKAATDPRAIVTLFLQKLGMIDETIKATAYYQRKSTPKVTYIEFHRGWEKMGLPILNPVGVINLSETQDFDDLSLTSFAQEDLADEDIIFASDSPGKARKTDFNTLTVAVTDDGSLLSINSSLRLIEKKETLAGLGLSLLEPEKIVTEVEKGGSYFDITLPSGQGMIDFAKVYPQNQLLARKAIITDLTLAFMEKPKGIYQKYLQPVYLVRGSAETETGIRVKFAQTVPALEDQALTKIKIGTSLAVGGQNRVLGKQAQNLNFFQRFLRFFFRILKGPTPTPPPVEIQAQPTPIPEQPKTIKLETFVPTLSPSPTPTSTPTPTSIPTATPTLRPTPTPIPPTATPKVTPTVTPTSTPTITPFSANTPTPTLALSEDACDLLDSEGNIAHRGVEFFVEGIGRLVYFPTLGRGPIAFVGTTVENIAARFPFFSKAENQILSVGAQNLLDDPTRIQYDHIGQLKLDIVYGFSVSDLFNAGYFRVKFEQAIKDNTLEDLAALPRPFPIPTDYLISAYSIGMRVKEARWDRYKSYRLEPGCLFLSITSPILYFYPEEAQRISVKFRHHNIAYVDPYYSSLQFIADTSGQLDFKGITRDKLYYEYTNITFAKPKKGWLVDSDNLEKFWKKELVSKLGLNQKEKEALLKDIKASLIGKEIKKYVFVSLIPQQEIEEKLLMEINPQPDNLHRLHLYLEFLEKPIEVESPDDRISIDRTGFTVVELGVYTHPRGVFLLTPGVK